MSSATIRNRFYIFLTNFNFPKNSKNTLATYRHYLHSRALFSTNIHNNNNEEKFFHLHQQQQDQESSQQLVPPQSTTTQTSQTAPNKTNTKILKVAIVGVPNAGKSTFINNLINHRVCPTSNKVHTTRQSNKAIYTTNHTQLVVFDTPGLVTEREIKKFHLESSFSSSYRHSIQHCNLIGVIQDVSNTWTRNELHSTVLRTLNAYPKLPSFLILNKIDLLKSKRVLLDVIKNLTNNTLTGGKHKLSGRIRNNKKSSSSNAVDVDANNDVNVNNFDNKKVLGWSNFSDVFMVSSINGDGLNDILHFLLHKAEVGNWEYPANVHTDQTPENLIVNSVRARLLDYLPQEIPYLLKSELEYYATEKGTIYASVQVICPTSRIERLICGESNGRLKQITERVTSDLVETFAKRISLTIVTKVLGKKSFEEI